MLLAVPVLLAPGAWAQRALHKNIGDGYPRYHGFAVAAAGDVNADGTEDYWMGAPPSYACRGFAYLVSGVDGSTLLQIETAPACQDWPYEVSVALAGGRDVSGDGVPDVAIGAAVADGLEPASGTVRVHSGSDGALLYTVPGRADGDRCGLALAFVDDLDGDGVADLAVGVPGDDLGGLDRGGVLAVSGASGLVLARLSGLAAGDEFGTALAAAGDVDGDGREDLLVGAPHAELSAADSGVAVLVSGHSGFALDVYPGDSAGDLFGHAVAGAGDVDGDAVPDLLVGAPGGTYARVLSGADGGTLWNVGRSLYSPGFEALTQPAGFGAAVAGAGDQDGDGQHDFAVGYPRYSGVWLFSGADASVLALYSGAYIAPVLGDSFSSYLGFSLARLGDLDGDGRPELAAGVPNDLVTHPDLGITSNTGSSVVLSGIVGPRWVYEGEGFVNAISGAGDVDGDGCDDLAYSSGVGEASLTILSGRNRTVLRSLDVHAGRLARAGDANADGVEDLVVVGSIQGTYATFVLSGATSEVLLQLPPSGAMDRVGDMNGDGYDDIVLSTDAVKVYSGSDGAVLLSLEGEESESFCEPQFGEFFGYSLAGVGDWDRDGILDVAASAPLGGENRTGEVRVFSGADGALLQEFAGDVWCEFYYAFGISIAGAPDFDVDADGYVDLLVGEQHVAYGPHAVTSGGATVYSSRTGAQLPLGAWWQTQEGYGRLVGPGYSVTEAGDFDGDGHSDFAVGNPTEPSLLGPGAGEVLVLSGRDNSVLARIQGTSSWDYLGYYVTAAGDTNGDGLSEVFVHRPTGELPSAVDGAFVLMGGRKKVRENDAPDGRFRAR